jgi:cytosine/uracil/thiamine/allantoin permease
MQPISPLRAGALASLASLGFAAVVGLIAVVDANAVQSAVGVGLGIAVTVFAAGATIVCGLACLARGRVELPALAAVVAAGVALDLLVLALWLDIQSEAYGKAVGVGFVWTFFALLVLGLTLALGTPRTLARALYLAAVTSCTAAGLISTWLVVRGGDGGSAVSDPLGAIGSDGLLRALGAALVLVAAFWFGALAAGRLEAARG